MGPSDGTKNTILFKLDTYKCADLAGGKTDNGTPIQIWTCNNKEQQTFVFDSSTGELKSKSNDKKCVDLTGGSATNGNHLQLW